MAEIKAIETVFDGYKFRSRLEARWACFFKEAGIEYQYEPEGYVLDDGSCYLPDFYISDCFSPISDNLFVEVKATMPSEEECTKARYLSKATKTPVLIVSQIPEVYTFNDAAGELCFIRSDGTEARTSLEGLKTLDHGGVFNDTWLFKDGADYGCGHYIDIPCAPLWKVKHNALITLGLGVIWAWKAYKKARQARFEHGQKG